MANSPTRSSDTDVVPNPELIRRLGWAVVAVCGRYCVASRGSEQLTLEWRNGGWERIAGKGDWRAAA